MGYEKWTFNGFDLTSDGKWDVEEVLEGVGIPKFRGSDLQMPFQHGTRWIKKKFDRRKVVLSMWVRGTSRSDLDTNIDSFLRGIGKLGVHTLRRTMRSGAVREAQAEVVSEINFVTKNPGYAKFALEFELADPFFYGTTKATETKSASTGSVKWSHAYAGTAPCTAMQITFTGPLSSPKITNETNAVWLQYLGKIAVGETVILDTKYFKCTKGVNNMISAIRHGGDAYWMTFEYGANSMKLETGTTGGSAKIAYYPAYF